MIYKSSCNSPQPVIKSRIIIIMKNGTTVLPPNVQYSKY